MSTAPLAVTEAADTGVTEERITIVREPSGIAAIRDEWLALQGNEVTSDPDFFLAGLESDPKIVRPHLVLLERGGRPHAMLVGRIESLELPVKLGYKKLLAPRVRSITVVYGGVLGEMDEPAFRTLLVSLRRSLAEREADVCVFLNLPVNSPWYRIAASEPSFLHRQHVSETAEHWELDLPASLDDLKQSMSKKTRQNINTYANRLRRDFGETLHVRVYEDPGELDEFFRDVETVAAKTYQRGLGVAFGDTPAHRRRTAVSMEQGWFRGYVLHLGGRPAAFRYGDLYRGKFRAGRPGYDPEFGAYRPGTHLLLWSIDDLCRDTRAEVLDLGIGDAEFKQRICNRHWEEGSVTIYAPRLRPVAINLTRSVLLKGIARAKRVAQRRGLQTKLKRRWRDRLRSERAA